MARFVGLLVLAAISVFGMTVVLNVKGAAHALMEQQRHQPYARLFPLGDIGRGASRLGWLTCPDRRGADRGRCMGAGRRQMKHGPISATADSPQGREWG